MDNCPFTKAYFLFIYSFSLISFASTAGGLRNCNAAAFASLVSRLHRDSQNGAANFVKEAKAAALQLRSPPAAEAKHMN
jgi:hypothetical protein